MRVLLLSLLFFSCVLLEEPKIKEKVKSLPFIILNQEGKEIQSLNTFREAIELINGGETILIRNNTHNKSLNIENKKYTIPIKIMGEKNTIYDGKKVLEIGINIKKCTNIDIINLKFKNYKTAGITVKFSNNVRIKNCTVYDNGFDSKYKHKEGFGIDTQYNKNVEIKNNVVYNNGPKKILRENGILGTGINTYALTDSFIINNITYNNNGGGILVEDGINVIVDGNETYGNNKIATEEGRPDWWCGGIWLDGGCNIYITNNIVYNNMAGLYISNIDSQEVRNYIVKNNYVYNNVYGFYFVGLGIDPVNNSVFTDISNNNIINNDNNIFANTTEYCKERPTILAGNFTIDNVSVNNNKSILRINGDWIYNSYIFMSEHNYIRFMHKSTYKNGILEDINDVSSVQIVIDNVVYERWLGGNNLIIKNDYEIIDGVVNYITYEIVDDLWCFEWDIMGQDYVILNGDITFTIKK